MILSYDLESTGFINKSAPLHDPSQPRLVQLGAILDHDDGVEAMRLDITIYCDNIPIKASDIHGITTEMSKRIGVNEAKALDLFLDMVEVADVIVGQNVIDYDNVVITANARRIYESPDYEPFAGKEVFDTMVVGQPICKLPSKSGYRGFKRPNLTELHKFLFNGEGFEGAHTAIHDVLATRRCYYELKRRIENVKAT